MASSTASIFTFKYVDHAETIAIGATLPAVCIGVVALRFYTRTRQSVNLGIDDWLILGALVRIKKYNHWFHPFIDTIRYVSLEWVHVS